MDYKTERQLRDDLCRALEDKNIAESLALIEQGAPLGRIERNLPLPINLISDRDMQDVVLAMVRHNSPLNIPDSAGQLPIEWAASNSLPEVVEAMVRHGSPVTGKLSQNARRIVEVGSMVKEFTTRVVVPVLFEGKPEVTSKFTETDWNALVDTLLVPVVANVICGPPMRENVQRPTPEQASRYLRPLRLFYSWEHPPVVMPTEKLPLLSNRSWHGICADTRLPFHASNGLEVRELTTSKELREEGRTLMHCVGRIGVDAGCSEAGERVFSIRSPSGKALSTVHCEPALLNNAHAFFLGDEMFAIKQHRAFDNRLPPSEATEAFEEFRAAVAAGKLPLAQQHGETEESREKTGALPLIARKAGYMPSMPHINAVFDEYKKDIRRAGMGPDANGRMVYDPHREDFIQGYGEVKDGKCTGRFFLRKEEVSQDTQTVDVRRLDALNWMKATGLLEQARGKLAARYLILGRELRPVWKAQDERLEHITERLPPRNRVHVQEMTLSPLQKKKDRGHFI